LDDGGGSTVLGTSLGTSGTGTRGKVVTIPGTCGTGGGSGTSTGSTAGGTGGTLGGGGGGDVKEESRITGEDLTGGVAGSGGGGTSNTGTVDGVVSTNITDGALSTSSVALETVGDCGGTGGTGGVLHVVTSLTLGTGGSGSGSGGEGTGSTIGIGARSAVRALDSESGVTDNTTLSLISGIDTVGSTISEGGGGGHLRTGGGLTLGLVASQSLIGSGDSVVSVVTEGTSVRGTACFTARGTRSTPIVGPDLSIPTDGSGGSWVSSQGNAGQ
jgi:hypothetical protein